MGQNKFEATNYTLGEVHRKILNQNLIIQGKETANKLRNMLNKIFNGEEQKKIIASFMRDKLLNELSNEVGKNFQVNEDLGLGFNNAQVERQVGVQLMEHYKEKHKDFVKNLDKLTEEAAFASYLEKMGQSLQGFISKYNGEVSELLFQYILNSSAQLFGSDLKDITEASMDFLKQENPKLNFQKLGDKPREISVTIDDTNFTISSSQKSDLKIPFLNVGYLGDDVGASLKNYASLGDISLVTDATTVYYASAFIQAQDFEPFMRDMATWNRRSKNLTILKPVFGMQALMGVHATNGAKGKAKELLSSFLIVFLRNAKREPIRVLPSAGFIEFMINSRDQKIQKDAFIFSIDNLVSRGKEYEKVSHLSNKDLYERLAQIKMSIKLKSHYLTEQFLKEFYNTK